MSTDSIQCFVLAPRSPGRRRQVLVATAVASCLLSLPKPASGQQMNDEQIRQVGQVCASNPSEELCQELRDKCSQLPDNGVNVGGQIGKLCQAVAGGGAASASGSSSGGGSASGSGSEPTDEQLAAVRQKCQQNPDDQCREMKQKCEAAWDELPPNMKRMCSAVVDRPADSGGGAAATEPAPTSTAESSSDSEAYVPSSSTPSSSSSSDDSSDDAEYDWDDDRGALDFLLYGKYQKVRDPELVGDMDKGYAAGFTMRMGYGSQIAFGMGFDLELGGARGIMYGADFLLGPAFMRGQTGVIGLLAGIGGDGVKDRIPGAFHFPVELYAATNLSESIRLMAYLQPRWVFGVEERKKGTAWEWADEVTTGARVAFGSSDDEEEVGAALSVGFFYREQMRTSSLGVTVGLAGWLLGD